MGMDRPLFVNCLSSRQPLWVEAARGRIRTTMWQQVDRLIDIVTGDRPTRVIPNAIIGTDEEQW